MAHQIKIFWESQNPFKIPSCHQEALPRALRRGFTKEGTPGEKTQVLKGALSHKHRLSIPVLFLLLSRSHQEWWSAARAAHRNNLLHPARSCVSLVIRSVLTYVHFVMLLLYDIFGLPRLGFPLTFPWITHFTSSHQPSLIVWQFVTDNRFLKLSGGVRLCEDNFACSVFSPTDSEHPTVDLLIWLNYFLISFCQSPSFCTIGENCPHQRAC